VAVCPITIGDTFTLAQTQPERVAAIRFSGFGSFKLNFICCKGFEWRYCVHSAEGWREAAQETE
jgi:hypothetical protein